MRDLLMVAIFAAAIPLCFARTWIAVMVWTWISIMNPHKLAFGFAVNMPFALIVALAAFMSILIDRERLHFPKHAAITCLLLFLLWTGITTFFALNPGLSADQLWKIVKIQSMTLVALAAIRERKHIEAFIAINALSIGFYGVKGGIFTITTGGSGRVQGPSGGFIEGNNEIGLAMVVVIPLLNYLREVNPHRWLRRGLAGIMVLCALAALGTQSRGAFLAIACMTLVLWTRSQRKGLVGLILVVFAAGLVTFMPQSWEDRMSTIKTYQSDGSAMGRINAWQMAFNLANDRFLGAGFAATSIETFAKYAPIPEDIHAAHSIYFQVLGEHGWVGLALYLAIGFFTLLECARLRKAALQIPEAKWIYQLVGMIQVSMVGFAVGGAFLSLAYFDLPFNIMVMVIACRYWISQQRWKLVDKSLPKLLPGQKLTRMDRFWAWLK